jgi:hypothetical protein
MVALLAANPEYCSWGPYEDYMAVRGESWGSAVFVGSWREFGPWELDEYNEVVNFYFQLERASTECATCGGDGYHPDSRSVTRTFYAHMNPAGEHWNDSITQDELDALKEAGRVEADSHLSDVNYLNTRSGGGFGMHTHDAINRAILTSARLKRLGLPERCPTCGGNGSVYTEPAAHVNLILWFLHPRKGCSRGVEVKNIQREDLPAVREFLTTAARRNADRFAGLPALAE